MIDDELDDYLHLYTLNRGIVMTPFHNMALMCPATTEADVDRAQRGLRRGARRARRLSTREGEPSRRSVRRCCGHARMLPCCALPRARR